VACHTIEDNKSYTYSTINDSANQLAGYFQYSLGLIKGDRVCVLSENCIENIILFAVAQKIGIILVPLNYRLTKIEIKKLLDDASPALLLHQDSFEHLAADDNIKCKTFLLRDILNDQIASKQAYQQADIDLEDALFILYTSGSSGFPKGAIYTHKMLFWNSINTAISLHISNSTVTLNVMPPFHTGGWNVLVTPVLHHGGKVILMKNFSADIVLSQLEKLQCNQFMAVPTMLKILAEDDNFASSDLSTLHYIIVGGEAMPVNLIKRYSEKSIAIRQGYGMTEVGPNLTSLHDDFVLDKIGSIGKANMYIDIKLLDDTGKEVKNNERGELCLSGPCVTPGYWNNEIATNSAFKNGWFCSGDIAVRDDDGFLFIVDRIKNMFISGGENVYPAEIEKVLLSDSRIAEAVVIGVPHLKWGEVGKAFIVKKNKNLSTTDIIDYLKKNLSKYKIPKHLEFINSIPKLSNGKIDRNYFKEDK